MMELTELSFEETGRWENIGGEFNEASNTVTVVTNHFSIFTVFEANDKNSDVIVPIAASDNTNQQTENKGTDQKGNRA